MTTAFGERVEQLLRRYGLNRDDLGDSVRAAAEGSTGTPEEFVERMAEKYDLVPLAEARLDRWYGLAGTKGA
jgi:hypothetical protein